MTLSDTQRQILTAATQHEARLATALAVCPPPPATRCSAAC
ncbi:hypothetical protein ACFQU2_28030 [Siccirubricoccus deserti]